MIENEFFKLKFPLLPYCEMNRGPSTKFDESFHIKNKNTGITLNFWYCKIKNKMSVNLYDSKEKHEKDRNRIIPFNNTVEQICIKYLK